MRAGPRPIFGSYRQPGLDGIPFDIYTNAFFFCGISHPVIERFVLPEWFAGPAENPVCIPRGYTFNSTRNVRKFDARREQHVNVVRHDYVGMQNVLVEFVLTSSQSCYDRIRDCWDLQPDRAESRTVQVSIEIGKLLPGFMFVRLRLLN